MRPSSGAHNGHYTHDLSIREMTRNLTSTTRFLLALLLSLGLASGAMAGPDKDKDRRTTPTPRAEALARAASAGAPDPGNCSVGRAQGTLDVNQVQATIYTVGTLFYGPGGEHQYYVPQQARLSPIYASSVWIAGQVGGELRVAGATYGQGGTNNDYFEFWPGPLNDDGTLPNPNDCSAYDKIWSVSRQQIAAYESGAAPAEDLATWPADLGAPVIDGDGDPNNYNLAGGDRPDIIGDQSLWYVINDVGNLHRTTDSDPIGIEVKIQAFSFARDNALGQTTFYKYTIEYKGDEPLEDAYLSVWSDPDLGNAADDFVGVDVETSMGFVYNADEVDEGSYGTPPPAAGYDFFQGPLVDSDDDGDVDEDDERLGVSSFMYFVNGDANRGDPGTAEEYYNIMRGSWSDGTPLTAFGNGYATSGEVTKFAFPGDPVSRSFWSEENNGAGRDVASDRRFVISTGPFTINPGDSQEIVFGIVYAVGNNRLSSITALRAADVFAQNAYDLDFNLPNPAPAPVRCDDPSNPEADRLPGSGTCLYATELDGELVLNWGYAPTDAAFLGDYESEGYEFEGFNVYRYPNGQFSRGERQLVATFDKVNDITTLQNIFFDPEVGDNVPVLAAQGTDSGLAYSYRTSSLTNYTDYYYGVTTYIVDPTAEQERVIESAPTFITVRPSSIANANGGTMTQSEFGDSLPVDDSAVVGGGQAFADIVDPTQLTGDSYRVRYYSYTCEAGEEDEEIITYNIENVTTGAVLYDGSTYAENNSCEIRLSNTDSESIVSADGLQFRVTAPPEGAQAIVEVNAPGGGPACTPGDASAGCAAYGGDNVFQSYNSTNQYILYFRSAGSLSSVGAFAPNDYEIRFVPLSEGGYAEYGFDTGRFIQVPFEVWDIGIVPPGTENDPSDDIQMVPVIFSDEGTDAAAQCEFKFGGPTIFGLGLTTQRIYAYYPVDNDYEAYEAAAAPVVAAADGCADYDEAVDAFIDFGRGRPLQRDVLEDAGIGSVANLEGAVIRYYTYDPVQTGDTFVFNTADYVPMTEQGFDQEAADRIGVVPNPYYGYSAYESGNTERVARFTNLPQRATIRIFTISGTLIRTLEKDNAARSFDWNLQTENNLPVASGLYLIHIELPDSGLERVIKFGVVNRQTQIEIL